MPECADLVPSRNIPDRERRAAGGGPPPPVRRNRERRAPPVKIFLRVQIEEGKMLTTPRQVPHRDRGISAPVLLSQQVLAVWGYRQLVNPFGNPQSADLLSTCQLPEAGRAAVRGVLRRRY